MRLAATALMATMFSAGLVSRAAGQGFEDHLRNCNGANAPPQLRIAGCEAVIGLGRLDAANLAIAHSNRANAFLALGDTVRAVEAL